MNLEYKIYNAMMFIAEIIGIEKENYAKAILLSIVMIIIFLILGSCFYLFNYQDFASTSNFALCFPFLFFGTIIGIALYVKKHS